MATQSRSYQQVDLKRLFGKSGLFCAFPGCKNRLIAEGTPEDDEKLLAYIAHIVSHSDKGPRADPTMDPKLRDKYENLVLLCGHHHTLVDAQDSTYTVADLRGWKAALELWAYERLSQGMSDVRFAELQVVCDAIVANAPLMSTALTAVPPAEKMQYNDLTSDLTLQFSLGLSISPQVEQYLEAMATRIDPSFPGRLRAGFVTEYDRLRGEGQTGDSLFLGLLAFASSAVIRGQDDHATVFKMEAAALAVQVHLFQICDVFEPPTAG